MTPLDKGKEQEIVDVGNLNDLREGDLICWVATQKVAREVYDIFEFFNEAVGEPRTAKDRQMKEKFKRVYSFIHKRVRYSYEFGEE